MINMKRSKKAIVEIIKEQIIRTRYEVQCPHCKTHLINYVDKYMLRISCLECKNPIELVWEEGEI